MKFDLVVIGHLAYDENKTVNDKKTVFGGACFYTAIPASIFSKKIGIVSRVGDDYNIGILKRQINTDGLIIGGKSTRFYHKYSSDYKTRTFRGDLNVGKKLTPKDIPNSYLNSKFIHIATMPPKQQLSFIKYLRTKSKAYLSIDTLEQYIKKWPRSVFKALDLVDIVFINQREFNLIKKLKGKRMIIKKGPKGADYIFGNEKFSLPAPKVKLIDPTGSGDVLAGVFLVLLTQNKNPKIALRKAIEVASISVTDFGVDFLIDYYEKKN